MLKRTESDLRQELAKLQDDRQRLIEENEAIAAAAISTRKEITHSETLLWLLHNAVLKPEGERVKVEVKGERVETTEW